MRARGMRRRTSGLLLAAALLIAAPRARAADSPTVEAETLIRQGVELRRQGQDERALPFFQKAHELSRTPRSAGQLGLAELSVGYWLDSERHLAEALAYPDHPWVAKNRASLEQSLKKARANIGEVTVTGLAGAEVRVNGSVVGQLPLAAPLRLARGPVELELSAPGHVTARRTLTIAGEAQTVAVTLEAESARTSGGGGGAKDTGGANPLPPPHPLPPKDTPDDGSAPGRTLRLFAWGTGGLALAAIAAGVVETVRWQSGVSDFNNHKDSSNQVDCLTGQPDRGGAACKSLYDKYTSAEGIALGAFVAGGVLAAGSAILFVVSSRRGHEESHASLVCAPDLLHAGATCRLVF